MLRKCLYITLLMCMQIFAELEDKFIVELTKDSFESAIKTSNHFVMFYAPWCGHCKRLHPLWDQIAEINNVENPLVVIAKVDCTKHQELCASNEITGYPTLKFFKPEAIEAVKFKGTRDLPTISEFIQDQLGRKDETVSDDDKSAVAHNLIELTDENFHSHIATGKHFIKFYAPWCSHCQRLAPTWEELANTLANDASVKVAKIDCTVHRPICHEYEVKGYPTLLWIEDGKKIAKYSGGRGHDDLTGYVNEMLGSTTQKNKEMNEMASSGDDKKPDEKVDNEGVVLINRENFKKRIESGITFVKFYAPWCGHCQKLSPVWDQLAIKIHGQKKGVQIAKVDCTLEENKQLCIDQQVEGYPTLYLYKNAEKMNEYNGNRQLDDLYEFAIKPSSHDEL